MNVPAMASPLPRTPFAAFLGFMRRDGRHFQLLWLSAFLCYGLLALGWNLELWRYASIILTALSTQLLCTAIQKRDWRLDARDWSSLKSAGITSLGLCLLCKANMPLTLVFAAFVAIAGKFVLRWNGKHIFNPANLGLVAAVLLTGDAWVSPGQWGSNATLLFLIGICGSVVVLRVGRMDTSLAFIATFAGLMFLRNVVHLGWDMDFWTHQMMNGSLLLFTFFMITDPVTTPNARPARLLWAACVGVLAYFLSVKYFVYAGPVWALIVLSPLTPLFDRLFRAERFSWAA